MFVGKVSIPHGGLRTPSERRDAPKGGLASLHPTRWAQNHEIPPRSGKYETVSIPHGGLRTEKMTLMDLIVPLVSIPHGGLRTSIQTFLPSLIIWVSIPHGGLRTGLLPMGCFSCSMSPSHTVGSEQGSIRARDCCYRNVSIPHGGLRTTGRR